ncbi:hypothetical protein E3N88_07867 [Mikania micrantha]|uniref:Uncharacterized protein n=1 Tax=Mikania micrantha TaxID=192012 RepID=A0A5N6PF13_9ASTR|nr:hypothetical protein E3N88_07867 [Mikania micrantha]
MVLIAAVVTQFQPIVSGFCSLVIQFAADCNSIHDDIDDFVAGKDVEGTLHHDSVVSKGSLSRVRYSNESGLVYKNGLSGVGQPQPNSSFSLPFDNGEGELVWWEADTSLDQVASGMKVTHDEHSVMMQDLSTTHSNNDLSAVLQKVFAGPIKKWGLIFQQLNKKAWERELIKSTT